MTNPSTIVSPGPLRVSAVFPPATIAIRDHLWLWWAGIAIRRERDAWLARSRHQPGQNFGREIEESIQSVSAVRHCFENLWLEWQPRIEVVGGVKLAKQRQLRPKHFTTHDFADMHGWLRRVRAVVSDRIWVIHHLEADRPTYAHPVHPTNASELAVRFTPERSTEAVDVMLDDVLGPAIRHPSAAMRGFAPETVLDQLLAQRATGEDFY